MTSTLLASCKERTVVDTAEKVNIKSLLYKYYYSCISNETDNDDELVMN